MVPASQRRPIETSGFATNRMTIGPKRTARSAAVLAHELLRLQSAVPVLCLVCVTSCELVGGAAVVGAEILLA